VLSATLVLSLVVGAARVPLPETVKKFPNTASFNGVGARQEANMVYTVLGDAGGAMRSHGPGPQQIVSRWVAGKLNSAEKVSVLLGGAAFHDPALLRIYDEAASSPDARVRMAAIVGFYALIGDVPPAPSSVRDTARDWERFADLVRRLGWAARSRTLVHVWADSFVASKGYPLPERFVFRRSSDLCLRAIREIAEPEDLPHLLALWPLLRGDEERAQVMRTIEMISFQRLVDRSLDPSKPHGEWQINAGVALVDSWVAGLCRSLDGTRQLEVAFEAADLVERGEAATTADWFAFLNSGYPSHLPLAVERLADLGCVAVEVDRQRFENPANKSASRKVLERFPISSVPPPHPRSRRR
jgi:hypothetical protein